MADTLAVFSGIRHEVVTAVKKAAAVAAAMTTAAEGQWALVSAAAKMTMASADNSGNGGAGLATYSNILDIFGICRFYLRRK